MRAAVLVALTLTACGFSKLPELTGDAGAPADAAPDTPTVGPPVGLAYARPFALYTEGVPIRANAPTVGGEAPFAFAISPALPDGLALDPATGTISGTAASFAALAAYTIDAKNAQGTASAKVTLGVNANGVISAYAADACARVAGAAKCWGSNFDGDLGNGNNTQQNAPVAVTGLSSGVSAVATGGFHTCAIVNGGAQCWGDNADGNLGNNSMTVSFTPVTVSGLTSGVQAFALGFVHTCAIVNGGMKCWGSNREGQLGSDTQEAPVLVPVPVQGLTSGVEAIAAGDDHTCAVVNGAAMCWGDNLGGELGNGSIDSNDHPAPTTVTGLSSGVAGIGAGDVHSCAIVNGAAMCWGRNKNGQLGNNSTTDSAVPVQVAGLTSGVQQIDGGSSYTCALVNGGVKCWGLNSSGQLGNGGATDSPVPVQVTGLTTGVQAIAVGSLTACALVGGGVQCWGSNAAGAIGNNTTTDSAVPTPTSGLSNITP